MRALTLWQPWASLVACGAKRLETRSWRTGYRGPVAIHSSCAKVERLTRNLSSYTFDRMIEAVGVSDFDTLPKGVILATVDLLDCVPACGAVEDANECLFGDYTPGRFVFVLGNLRRLAIPVRCRGSQRLWRVPAEVEAQVLIDA